MKKELTSPENGQSDALPALLTSESLLAIAEQAEKRVEALNKIRLVALKTTNAKDWTDHEGKPWLQESGATKVARLFGVSWNFLNDEIEKFEDGHFQYTITAKFTLADIETEAIGSRQSNDGFFNRRYKWDEKAKKKLPHDLPPTEIDKGDVKKAAVANCLARGITTILGIKNLTWEEIEKYAAFKKADATQIQYGKGKKKSPGKKAPPNTETNNGDKVSFKNKLTCPAGGPEAGKEINTKFCHDVCKESENCDTYQEAIK